MNVKLNGKFLRFNTYKDFEDMAASLRNKSDDDLDAFEKQLGFTSLRSVYKQTQQSQMKLTEKLRQMPDEMLAKMDKRVAPQSDFMKQHLSSLMVEDSGSFRMNIARYELATLVDKDGFVAIGVHIFQHTYDYVKVLTDGNLDKLNDLKNATKDNASKNIIVKPIQHTPTFGGGRTDYVGSSTGHGSGQVWEDGQPRTVHKRVKAFLTFSSYYNPIYDYNDASYQECVDRQVFTQETCTPPLIGWQYTYSTYDVGMNVEEKFYNLWFWCWDSTAESMNMQGSFSSNNGGSSFNHSDAYSASINYPAYSGNFVNISSASNSYSAGWYSILTPVSISVNISF